MSPWRSSNMQQHPSQIVSNSRFMSCMTGVTSAALFPSCWNKRRLTLGVRCRTVQTSVRSPCTVWRVSLCALRLRQAPLPAAPLSTEWQQHAWHSGDIEITLGHCLWGAVTFNPFILAFKQLLRQAKQTRSEPSLCGVMLQWEWITAITHFQNQHSIMYGRSFDFPVQILKKNVWGSNVRPINIYVWALFI